MLLQLKIAFEVPFAVWRRRFTLWLLGASVLFAPWAFGATQSWAIISLNFAGTALGLLWLLARLGPGDSPEAPVRPPRHWTSTVLGAGTILLLLYSFLASVNARSAFDVSSGAFFPLPHCDWLPHSSDRGASWLIFWQNVALAGTFWAARDWLLPRTAELAALNSRAHTGLLPLRVRRFLTFIIINGFLLAVVALLQRLDGTGKLLWLVTPHINQTAAAQFGPFAYRSNGLQYLALIWPLALGCWSMLSHAQRQETIFGSGRRAGMLLGGLTLAICPLLWQSRLSLAVDLATVLFVVAVLLKSHPLTRRRLVFLLGFAGTIALGLALNWHALAARLAREGWHSRERLELIQTGATMFRDNGWFGTGPGSFASQYLLYRPESHSPWMVQMHCDWLQTLVTYGAAGSLLLAAMMLAVFFSPARPGQLVARKSFILLAGASLAGGLAHALVDFPFQVYSIQHLFVVLAAFISVLSFKR